MCLRKFNTTLDGPSVDIKLWELQYQCAVSCMVPKVEVSSRNCYHSPVFNRCISFLPANTLSGSEERRLCQNVRINRRYTCK